MSGLRMTEEALRALPAGYKVRELGQSARKPRSPTKAPHSTTPPAVAPTAIATKDKPTAKERMQAKGRLPKGTMNATETKYAAYLDQLRLAGEVVWWKFEAITLTLAPKTTITVDFAVMLACGSFEMHDVKGAKAIYEDDAKVKMKVAAQMFPFVFRVAFPVPKADGGGWNIELVRD